MTASPLDAHAASPSELQARIAAERSGTPFLIYRDGEGAQRIVPLDESLERVTLGRSRDADVPLTWDSQASRLHAFLERTVDGWTVIDDGRAMNGTFLNYERLHGRRRLSDRDILQVGDTVIAFRDLGDLPEEATAPAKEPPARPPAVTESQRRVLVALCRPFGDGRPYPAPATNEEIAKELFLSVDAVKTHLRALFQRFDLDDAPRAHKRVRLVERAFETRCVGEADFG